MRESIVNVLEGKKVQKDTFLYEITLTCPWCGQGLESRTVIPGAPWVHYDETWMCMPRGVEVSLRYEGHILAHCTHACTTPWN